VTLLSTLAVSLVSEGDTPVWVLDEPLHFEGQISVTVPAGFVTDFASVPRIPLAYLLTGDTVHAAAVVHDYLYQTHLCSRAEADEIFYEAMAATDVPAWRRWLMYRAVRMFGGGAYASGPARLRQLAG